MAFVVLTPCATFVKQPKERKKVPFCLQMKGSTMKTIDEKQGSGTCYGNFDGFVKRYTCLFSFGVRHNLFYCR